MNIRQLKSLAIKQARKSLSLFKHGCVIANSERIISKGFNINPGIASVATAGCAEARAMQRAPCRQMLSESIMVVCRVNKNGNLGNSKPCKRCMRKIIKFGVKNVIYSTPKGWEYIAVI